MTDWLTDWWIDWLTDSLTGPTELTGWVACCMADWLTVLLTPWLTDSLTGWLADWLTTVSTGFSTSRFHPCFEPFFITLSVAHIPLTFRKPVETLCQKRNTLLAWHERTPYKWVPRNKTRCVRLSCEYWRRWIADEPWELNYVTGEPLLCPDGVTIFGVLSCECCPWFLSNGQLCLVWICVIFCCRETLERSSYCNKYTHAWS